MARPSERTVSVEEMPTVASCQCEVVQVECFLTNTTQGRAWRRRASGLLYGWTGLRQGEKEVAEERVGASLRRHLQWLLRVRKKGRVLSKKACVCGVRHIRAEIGIGERPVPARRSLYEAAEVLWRYYPDLSEGSGDRFDRVRGHSALHQNREQGSAEVDREEEPDAPL